MKKFLSIASLFLVFAACAPTNEYQTYAIYGMNEQATDIEVQDYVKVSKGTSIQDSLDSIADHLSTQYFSDNGIYVGEIIDKNNKKMVTIDLKENENSTPETAWMTHYFQGSAQANATQSTLVESFLQRQYQGEWIDEVTFYYEGKPLEELDHINLSQSFLRN
jgi:hypothetical protein